MFTKKELERFTEEKMFDFIYCGTVLRLAYTLKDIADRYQGHFSLQEWKRISYIYDTIERIYDEISTLKFYIKKIERQKEELKDFKRTLTRKNKSIKRARIFIVQELKETQKIVAGGIEAIKTRYIDLFLRVKIGFLYFADMCNQKGLK